MWGLRDAIENHMKQQSVTSMICVITKDEVIQY